MDGQRRQWVDDGGGGRWSASGSGWMAAADGGWPTAAVVVDDDRRRVALGGDRGIFSLFIITNISFPWKCWIPIREVVMFWG